MRWYAVGNIDKVNALLESVTHLGKKVSQGWGRVNRWEVEPWAHDWSVFRQEVMRAIPSKDGISTECDRPTGSRRIKRRADSGNRRHARRPASRLSVTQEIATHRPAALTGGGFFFRTSQNL